MSEHVPAPLTPAGCDMSGLRYMPLILAKIRYSRLWARARYEPRLGFAAVNLWMAAWLSVPAASLEDDDFLLAELAMCDVETWKDIRDEVLHGWVRCSDGRLYHPVIAELALNVWRKRGHASVGDVGGSEDEPDEPPPAEKSVSDRIVNHPPIVSAEPPTPPSGLPPISINISKSINTTARTSAQGARADARAGECVPPDPLFDLFWKRYPLKMAPREARREWDAALARGATGEEILDGLAQHRFDTKLCWVKYPGNWLAGECWKCEGVPVKGTGNGWLDIIREHITDDDRILDLTPAPVRIYPVVGHG
jgi:Protein of unknown function (DUF1376)